MAKPSRPSSKKTEKKSATERNRSPQGRPAPAKANLSSSQTPSPEQDRYAEKRKSARLGISAVTRYIANGEEFVGVTKLINLGGLLLEVGEPLSLGTKIRCELNLPNTLEVFRAEGEVVYRNTIRGRLSHVAGEMGIKFSALDPACERMLMDLTNRYAEFNPNHSVYSKEMTTFRDPTIIEAKRDPSDELT